MKLVPRRSVVPAVVPSVFHRPELDVGSWPPKIAREPSTANEDGVMSLTFAVPAAVPFVFHSPYPAPSFAARYTSPAKIPATEGAAPPSGLMRVTIAGAA